MQKFSELFYHTSLTILALLLFLPPEDVGSQTVPQKHQTLVRIADELIKENQTQNAFDTLLFGIRQFDSVRSDEALQNLAYTELLNALTYRLSKYDTYGQHVSLKDRLPLLNEIISLTDTQGLDSLLAANTYRLGVTQSLLTNYEEAIDHFEKARFLSMSGNFNDLLLQTSFQLYKEYRDIGDTEKALETLIDLEKKSRELDMPYHIQTSTEALGTFYLNQKDYERSTRYIKEAIRIAEENGFDPYYSLSTLAILYEESDSVKKAMQTYRKAFEMLHTTPVDQEYHNKMARLSINIGIFYASRLQKNDSSMFFFEEALSSAKEINEQNLIAYAYENIAALYSRMGNQEKALEIRLERLPILKEIGDLKLLERAEWNIAGIYVELKDYENAYWHSAWSRYYSDSLLNLNKVQAIAELETAYETEKKEQEITLLSERSKKQQALQTGLIIIGALLLIMVIVAIIALRIKQKANRLINQQKKDLARTNHELNQLSQFKESLTNMIAHDMKNPLNAILGLSHGKFNQEKMTVIHRSGRQMLNMVTNMLDVQKFEEAKMTLNTNVHALKNLVGEAMLPLELLMHAKQIHINHDYDEHLMVKVDADLISRVIGNLLSNAIKFSDTKSTIDIVVKKDQPDMVSVHITDYGNGIKPHQIDHVFDKFWQGGKRDKDFVGSTGLGLTFCKLAVEAHGGKIRATSEYGKSTTFSFSVPLSNLDSIQNVTPRDKETNAATYLILESDTAVLNKYISKLEDVKVFEVGKINQVLKALDKENVKSPWKENLVSAMHAGNQAKFDELVGMLK